MTTGKLAGRFREQPPPFRDQDAIWVLKANIQLSLLNARFKEVVLTQSAIEAIFTTFKNSISGGLIHSKQLGHLWWSLVSLWVFGSQE